ncbi:MAG: Aminoglycoside phosphotransferase [Rhodospirillales bacterium]|nr:Aminoglycoside phosphotransferase [Rhodospirillales bacterium]
MTNEAARAPVDRPALLAGFLAAAGWGAADRRTLAGDASFRRYDRLFRDGESAVLMDAAPPQEDVRPFLAVADILHRLGLSAPRILARDVAAGLLLLEDLGDGTYTRLLATGADENPLYALAVDALIELQRRFDPAAAQLPPYDEPRLLAEAALLVDWYLPAMSGETPPDSLREAYLDAWRAVLPHAASAATTLVLRDYHVDNLLHLPQRPGVAACGLLDFQDAVLGPSSYDLVSLLEDARRDVAPALAERMIERYLAAFPAVDRAGFLASYAVLGTQRNCKIVGIFTRLWRRDGKPQYLPHIARVWRLIERDLAHPALAPVADWLADNIPSELRGIPPRRDAP